MLDNRELEADALAYFLWHPRMVLKVDLSPDDFAVPRYAKTFRVIAGLVLDDGVEKIDPGLLEARCRAAGLEPKVGEFGDLVTRDVVAIDQIAAALRDLAWRRAVALEAERLRGAALTPTVPLSEAIDAHVTTLLATGRRETESLVAYDRVLRDQRDQATNPSPRRLLVPTGFASLDHVLGGLGRGALTIIAGRTGKGKSAFIQQVCEYVGGHGQALLATPEMRAAELGDRALARACGIDLWRIRLGVLSSAERHQLAGYRPPPRGLFVYDAARQTSPAILLQARAVTLAGKLDLLAVDYVQYLADRRDRDETRASQLGRMARDLKALGRELGCAVLLGAQLNRRVEDRGEEAAPRLSDLRESGDLEQDADVVLFLHGPHDATMRVVVAKHRGGPVGEVSLGWEPAFTRFVDRVTDPQQHLAGVG